MSLVFYMIPSQVFSHIVFVKKLCIVILYLLGHTGSITFLWTPLFYLLKPFTPLLGDTKGVNSANLCLGMWKVTSLLFVDKRWLKHAGNTQLCVIKLLLSADKLTPYFWAMNMVSKTRPIWEYMRYLKTSLCVCVWYVCAHACVLVCMCVGAHFISVIRNQ